MIRTARFAPAVIAIAAWGAAVAQYPESYSDPAEELIARERTRAAIEEAFSLNDSPTRDGWVRTDNFLRAAQILEQAGPAAVPALIGELEQQLPATFFLAAHGLGRIGTPEAERALREAIVAANEQPGDFALIRKAWVARALALMGRTDALDLINSGRHKAGHYALHGNTSTTETVAYLTAPGSVPILLAQLDRFTEDEDLRLERPYVVKALRRIAEPSSAPRVARLLSEPDRVIRKEAVRSLGTIGSTAGIDALLGALDDADPLIRSIAAESLVRLRPSGHLGVYLSHLETETNGFARRALYRLVVDEKGPAAVESLKPYRGRPDPIDRAGLLEAVGSLGTKPAEGLLLSGLLDPDAKVFVTAARLLAKQESTSARTALIGAIDSRAWPLAQTAIEELTEARESRAGGAIARRLYEVELAAPKQDPAMRPRLEKMCWALVTLRHADGWSRLREAAARQSDTFTKNLLNLAADQLEAIEAGGDSVEKWTIAADSPVREIRVLAFARLGELGGEQAATALSRRFGRVEPDEGVAILDALGDIDAAPSRATLERVLGSAHFDAVELRHLRDMAAWSARRIGGPGMVRALEDAVNRRHGRDIRAVVYYAILAGPAALPTLDRIRLTRLRYPNWFLGWEQEMVDTIRRDLAAGRPLEEFDVSPELLKVH